MTSWDIRLKAEVYGCDYQLHVLLAVSHQMMDIIKFQLR